MSLPASKGFEVGSGFPGTLLTGIEHNDPFYIDEVRISLNNFLVYDNLMMMIIVFMDPATRMAGPEPRLTEAEAYKAGSRMGRPSLFVLLSNRQAQ
mmetsp:Transcript_30916/g.118498  ORF Transcript_30916/g.118498 Transcript_30916/m.118498 type:complete len:96 (+) Transcript_30916:1196-1483(+)